MAKREKRPGGPGRLEKLVNYLLCAQYSKRYQDILLQLPLPVLRGQEHADHMQRDKIAGALHAYVDLCAEQEFMHRAGAIPEEVWTNWREGIIHNFTLAGIRKVWEEVGKAQRYDGLRKLLES